MRYQNRNEVAKSHSFKQDFDTSLFLDQNHLIRLNHTNVPAEMASPEPHECPCRDGC